MGGETLASRVRGSSAPASRAQRAGLGNFCEREAGALCRAGKGKVRGGPWEHRGRRLPRAVRTVAPRSAAVNFAGAASVLAPPQGGGCETADPRELLCFAALCSALPAPPLGSWPRSGHCEPGVPAAPLEARSTEGPLLRVWRAPGPGGWNRPRSRSSPRSCVGRTLVPGAFGAQRITPDFRERKAGPRGPESLKFHLGEVVQ